MYAKNGNALMEPTAIDTLIQTVLPLANLITPNIPEAEKNCTMYDLINSRYGTSRTNHLRK